MTSKGRYAFSLFFNCDQAASGRDIIVNVTCHGLCHFLL